MAAKQLGIHVKTLRRWLAKDPTLRPVPSWTEMLQPWAKLSLNAQALDERDFWTQKPRELLPRVLSTGERKVLARRVRLEIEQLISEAEKKHASE